MRNKCETRRSEAWWVVTSAAEKGDTYSLFIFLSLYV